MESLIRAVRVEELILSGSIGTIGSVKYSELWEEKPSKTTDLPKAKPLFSNIKQYPAENEVVYVLQGPGKYFGINAGASAYYLPPLNIYGSPNHNAQVTSLTEEEYNEKTETGLNPFKEVESIRPLLPYHGDVTIEGRYGNSIRFGSTISGSVEDIDNNKWSNVGDTPGNPITIIRNGQVEESKDIASYKHILEDINGDDSSIYLCSNQQIKDFQKAGIGFKDYELSYKHML